MKKQIITEYSISNNGIKIAHLSDLHEKEGNYIIDKLIEIKPDVILITGDMFERRDENVVTYDGTVSPWNSVTMKPWQGVDFSAIKAVLYFKPKSKQVSHDYNTYSLLERASKIAPVYYSVGNHEWYFLKKDIDFFNENQIVLLDNRDTSVNIKGIEILIGGLSTRYDEKWLSEFSQKKGYKVLLMHHPEHYEKLIKGNNDKFDLILSGHAHGGQWRFFGRGVLAPDQGLFPKYHHGLYKTESGMLEVSAGLSNTTNVPRIGNPTEIVILHI